MNDGLGGAGVAVRAALSPWGGKLSVEQWEQCFSIHNLIKSSKPG